MGRIQQEISADNEELILGDTETDRQTRFNSEGEMVGSFSDLNSVLATYDVQPQELSDQQKKYLRDCEHLVKLEARYLNYKIHSALFLFSLIAAIGFGFSTLPFGERGIGIAVFLPLANAFLDALTSIDGPRTLWEATKQAVEGGNEMMKDEDLPSVILQKEITALKIIVEAQARLLDYSLTPGYQRNSFPKLITTHTRNLRKELRALKRKQGKKSAAIAANVTDEAAIQAAIARLSQDQSPKRK